MLSIQLHTFFIDSTLTFYVQLWTLVITWFWLPNTLGSYSFLSLSVYLSRTHTHSFPPFTFSLPLSFPLLPFPFSSFPFSPFSSYLSFSLSFLFSLLLFLFTLFLNSFLFFFFPSPPFPPFPLFSFHTAFQNFPQTFGWATHPPCLAYP